MKCYQCAKPANVSIITTIDGNLGMMHHFCKEHGNEKVKRVEKDENGNI